MFLLIGFGPRIFSFRRGETEFGLKPILAGAYVKIIGMHSLDEVDPEDEPRAYRQKSYPRRVLVASAGSLMHFGMAIAALFFLSLFGFGLLPFIFFPDSERNLVTVDLNLPLVVRAGDVGEMNGNSILFRHGSVPHTRRMVSMGSTSGLTVDFESSAR